MSFSSSAYPYRTVVYLTDTIGGQDWQGSGVLISPDEVLTASHVVYHQGVGTASDIVVTPDYNAGSEPFGSADGTSYHYNAVTDAHGFISIQQSQFDYAVIHLSQPFTGLGYMGLEANFQGGPANVAGYPASAGGLLVNSQQTIALDPFYSVLDGTAIGDGSSGGPVWITGSDGDPYVVGDVSSSDAAGQGIFAAITTAAFNQIENWVAQDDGTSVTSSTYTVTPSSTTVNENAGSLTFTVSRSNTSEAATVLISTVADQGFSNNANYQPINNQALTFAAGQATAQVSLAINDLGLTTGSETYRLIVQQTSPVTAIAASTNFTTLNNDVPTLVTVLGAAGSDALPPFIIAARAAVAQEAANVVNSAVSNGQIVPFTFTPGASIPAVASGESGEIVMHVGGAVTLPAGYTTFATDATAPVSVTGGSSDGQLIIAGTGGLNVTAGAGAGTVMAGGGNNLVALPAGSGDQYVYLGGGADTVQAVGGQATVDAGPGNNLLNLGVGNDYVVSSGFDTISASAGSVTVNVVSSGSALVFSGAASLFFSGSSNTSTVAAGIGTAAGADTVFANGGGGQFYGGSGSLLFVGGSGSSTAVGGAGNSTLFGGSSGSDVLVAGTGASTLVGTAGNTIVGLGTSEDMLVAGAGSESLVGSSGGGSDAMFASTGADAMFAGNGNDSFVASSGTAQMVGGSGRDLFVFVNGATGGHDTIWNFTAGQDLVALFGYGTGIVPSLLASATVSGHSTTITLPDNTTITFGNVTHLTASALFAG